ncbi:MAG: BtpA/SgcQ family protein [Planctomycetota bacterium]|nr:BtpA/SgcQ family protein [Planctomycetota bacterium]
MRQLLARDRPPLLPLLIGVVHLLPTPGAPRFAGDVDAILSRAREDARALAENGADALIVENFGDAPFFAEHVPAETVAALTRAVDAALQEAAGRPVGVNVLRNDARAALGICAATGASFLRVNVHSGAALTDQGLIEGRAAETLRERARLCPDVVLLADVHVKHALPLGGGSIADAAEETRRRGLADALIVSGAATGRPPEREELVAVRERVSDTPLLIGSGLDDSNAAELLASADGAIVGTWLKRGGRLEEPVDPERVRRLRATFDALA